MSVQSTSDRRRILSLHVAIAIVVPGFLALGWWQLERALSGNTLSWAYVFEWPVFAGYAVYVWWKLTHEAQPASATDEGEEDLDEEDVDEEDVDEELASYNRYLAALKEAGDRKHW